MYSRSMSGTTWANKSLATADDANFMNVKQLSNLYKLGWDIANHSC